MVKKASDIEKEARQLPPRERARLARSLIDSLDVGEDVDAEQAWLEEAERRLADYTAGVMESRPAATTFADLKNRLK